MIARRFTRFCELEILIPLSQFGFRRGRSCEDCLSVLNLNIYKAFLKNKCLGALFLDIQGAYDNVLPQILFNKLNNFRIPSGYKKFFINFLSSRTLKFYFAGKFICQRVTSKGLPQGSVLSPLLFNVYINDCLFHVPYNCVSIQFADDVVIFARDEDPSNSLWNLRAAFLSFFKWLNDIGLAVSVEKTQLIVFHRKRLSNLPDTIFFDDSPFSLSFKIKSKIKYLGLIMDSGLRWHYHIKEVTNKINMFTNILKWLAGSSWGINPYQCIRFVNATIRSQIEWGALWYINSAL